MKAEIQVWKGTMTANELARTETDGLPADSIAKTWQESEIRFHLTKHRYFHHYCGYCVFPERPVTEQGYDGLLTYVPVHGGITYARETKEGRMVYGFDCAHAGDEDKQECRYESWLMHEAELMALAILIAAKYEKAYLAAKDNDAKGVVIQAFTDKVLKVLNRDLVITNNFGVMINLLCGRL